MGRPARGYSGVSAQSPYSALLIARQPSRKKNDPAELKSVNARIFEHHGGERWAPFGRREDEIGNKINVNAPVVVVLQFYRGVRRRFRISNIS